MKTTALTQKHIELGAKMVPFAGFNMPVYYTGIKEEHNTVRQKLGVFDVSHMGEFRVSGNTAYDLLQYITTNDVGRLYPGKVQYSCMPNDKGGIVDDLLVYMMNKGEYLLVVNAANIEKDWDWINFQNKRFNAQLSNESDITAQIAIQGPLAIQAIETLTTIPLNKMEYYTHKTGKFAGFDNILVSTTGYTGSGGVEVYAPNDFMPQIWDKVLEVGEYFGIKPIGLGARDTLRLEAGFCLYGNDIDDTTSPIEAGLGWITKFNKDFIFKSYHQELKEKGVQRKLVGFVLQDKGVPRQHMKIWNEENEIGEVTSGTVSPYTGKAIGMGYVQTPYSKIGTEIFIESRNKKLKAIVTKPPFFDK